MQSPLSLAFAASLRGPPVCCAFLSLQPECSSSPKQNWGPPAPPRATTLSTSPTTCCTLQCPTGPPWPAAASACLPSNQQKEMPSCCSSLAAASGWSFLRVLCFRSPRGAPGALLPGFGFTSRSFPLERLLASQNFVSWHSKCGQSSGAEGQWSGLGVCKCLGSMWSSEQQQTAAVCCCSTGFLAFSAGLFFF